MALQINDGFQNSSPKPLDNKLGVFASGVFRSYTNVAEANATILPAYRSVGLTVLINTGSANVEYWYQAGTTDGNLVIKAPTSSVTSPITFDGAIGIQQSSGSQGGYLSNADWTTFNSKLSAAASVGGGTTIYANTTSGTANIKSLAGGGGLTITDSGTLLTLTPPTYSGANIGTGASIFTSNSGTNLQFRSIIVGPGLTATQNTSDITLTLANTFAPSPVSTSNATPIAIASVTIEDSSAGLLEVTVAAVVAGSATNCTIAKRYVQYCKQGGTLTLLGGPGDLIPEIDNGTFTTTSWTVSVNGSTNNFDIVVTGQASTTIRWTTKVTKIFAQ